MNETTHRYAALSLVDGENVVEHSLYSPLGNRLSSTAERWTTAFVH